MKYKLLDWLPREGATFTEAIVVRDYPYGFVRRCVIRYWLEYRKGRGVRMVSQTSTPIAGQVKGQDYQGDLEELSWNKEKPGTYTARGIGIMLQEIVTGHITWTTFNPYYPGGPKERVKLLADLEGNTLSSELIEIIDTISKMYARINPSYYEREMAEVQAAQV